MFGLPAILVQLALRGIPAEDIEWHDRQGADALCRGPWMQAYEETPYRGVFVEDNGSGICCQLRAGDAFVCVMHPGMQHGPIIVSNLRFFDGARPKPRLDLLVHAYPNPGMNPPPDQPRAPPFAKLHVQRTEDGFALTFFGKPDCRTAHLVCPNAGRWVFGKDGIPSRPK